MFFCGWRFAQCIRGKERMHRYQEHGLEFGRGMSPIIDCRIYGTSCHLLGRYVYMYD